LTRIRGRRRRRHYRGVPARRAHTIGAVTPSRRDGMCGATTEA
jgi:hypothetical protein